MSKKSSNPDSLRSAVVAPVFPSLSFLASTPHAALGGIKSLVAAALRGMAATGDSAPAPDATGLDDGGGER